MTLNWRDIRDRANGFVHSYKDAKDEDRDAKPFWKDLFALYGVDPRSIGSFEERVRMHGRAGVGKMDYFAPRKFLIEQKSRDKDLKLAYMQALDYFGGLAEDIRPRYIVLSDFARIQVYDLEAPQKKRLTEFALADLPKHVKKLAFIADQEVVEYAAETAIDVKAVTAVGKLHAALTSTNYPANDLSELMTRLVFCFFADDTGIFDKDALRRYLTENTKEDGSDIGAHLSTIFQVLRTPVEARQSAMHETLAALPYVNGGLFERPLSAIFGTRDIRKTLLDAIGFDWSAVSPAIFGSMFQSVMDERERHDLGAHYTSEKNILRVIGPLFLDELKEELEKARSTEKLNALWDKVATMTLLDPACGCGNFLVVSYRELRRIEIAIIERLYVGRSKKLGDTLTNVREGGQAHLGMQMDIASLSRMSVERMYGIEIESFPAEVAKLSLWLVDHMMNMELGALFGRSLRKLPLTESPHIVQGNALALDWEKVVPKERLTHILGNPPFLGARVMNAEQKADIEAVGNGIKNIGNLDFVTGWYLKASAYIQGTHITCAFVSTNSITQGEQVGILWRELIEKRGMHIQFAHRTFKWSNEAKGKAAVYCVIVGFGIAEPRRPRIFSYTDIKGEPTEVVVEHINPYLVAAPDVFLESRSKPICDVPCLLTGNQPIDGGLYLFAPKEKEEFTAREPNAERYFRRWIGADEFLNGFERWCLWLGEADPSELKTMPEVLRRIEAVKQYRLLSKRASTLKLAQTPLHFQVETMPTGRYVVLPEVSSERRRYIPLGYEEPSTLASNKLRVLPNATVYQFGVLQSEMHMAWTRRVTGRLKSDYQYSVSTVYNNFPWPDEPSADKKKKVEEAAQAVLDTRARYPTSTLADLYDPNTMPADLLKAHHALDRAVDKCYGPQTFPDEPARLEFLFERYRELVSQPAKSDVLSTDSTRD